jgi:hypothetical protein
VELGAPSIALILVAAGMWAIVGTLASVETLLPLVEVKSNAVLGS